MGTELQGVLVLMSLGTLSIVGGLVHAVYLRLPRPPPPTLPREEQVIYRVVLRHPRIYSATLLLVASACIVPAVVAARHDGWGSSVIAAGRGVALTTALMIAGQGVLMSADDWRLRRMAPDPAFDDIAPQATRNLTRLLWIKLASSKLLVCSIILALGLLIRFPLSLPLGLACYAPITLLYLIFGAADVAGRQIWATSRIGEDIDPDELR